MHAEIKKEKIHICEMTNVFSGREREGVKIFFFLGTLLYPSRGLVVECPALLSPLLMSRKVYGLLA